jgi:peptidoglycan/xylan/chitin deacetylase (PgdA/CDA1 family)
MIVNIPVLYFHSVAPFKHPGWYKSFITLELKYFSDMIHYLLRNKYTFVHLDEYFEIKNKERLPSKKVICLTFDDGYLDNYVYVYPILKKHSIKATIFVSPEYVDNRPIVRPSLEDAWNGKVNERDLQFLGFLSWEEMKIMERSKLIDIQSHVMTHTKYFISDRIIDFHNPHADYLYPIANLFPHLKSTYMTNDQFINLIPFGTPFFEQRSAVIANKVTINQNFIDECVDLLSSRDWSHYSFNNCYEIVKKTYEEYKTKDKLIVHTESGEEYKERVRNELKMSKQIIERELNKTVRHICWPHGDYNETCHQLALEEGYYSTSMVIRIAGQVNETLNRFDRLGAASFRNNRFLTRLKTIYSINSYRGIFPYNLVRSIYYKIKYHDQKG